MVRSMSWYEGADINGEWDNCWYKESLPSAFDELAKALSLTSIENKKF